MLVRTVLSLCLLACASTPARGQSEKLAEATLQRFIATYDQAGRGSRGARENSSLQASAAHEPTSRLASRDSFETHVCNIPRNFGKIHKKINFVLQNSGNSYNSLQFPAIPARFRKICGEKCWIC